MEIHKFAKNILHRRTKMQDLRRTGSWKPKKEGHPMLSRSNSEGVCGTLEDVEDVEESIPSSLSDLPPMRPRKSK